MMRYRRARAEGAAYFFTVALADRHSDLLTERIELLRAAVSRVKRHHPFHIVAMVVLPDHLHAIWRLPEGDDRYPLRWSLIKSTFSRAIPRAEPVRASRESKRERGLWQRRYWEHLIRDEYDMQTHLDYIHYNPVKHGLVEKPGDWPYSSIHRYIRMGWLPAGWGADRIPEVRFGERL